MAGRGKGNIPIGHRVTPSDIPLELVRTGDEQDNLPEWDPRDYECCLCAGYHALRRLLIRLCRCGTSPPSV